MFTFMQWLTLNKALWIFSWREETNKDFISFSAHVRKRMLWLFYALCAVKSCTLKTKKRKKIVFFHVFQIIGQKQVVLIVRVEELI